jgi:hypothetical protein
VEAEFALSTCVLVDHKTSTASAPCKLKTTAVEVSSSVGILIASLLFLVQNMSSDMADGAKAIHLKAVVRDLLYYCIAFFPLLF